MADKPKQYDIKVECQLPATLTYRVLADSPQAALELINKTAPRNVQYILPRRRNLKAIVYDAGTLIIRYTKSFLP